MKHVFFQKVPWTCATNLSGGSSTDEQLQYTKRPTDRSPSTSKVYSIKQTTDRFRRVLFTVRCLVEIGPDQCERLIHAGASRDVMLEWSSKRRKIWQGTGTHLRTGVPIIEKFRSHLVLDCSGLSGLAIVFIQSTRDRLARHSLHSVRGDQTLTLHGPSNSLLPIAQVYTRLWNVTPTHLTPSLTLFGNCRPEV